MKTDSSYFIPTGNILSAIETAQQVMQTENVVSVEFTRKDTTTPFRLIVVSKPPTRKRRHLSEAERKKYEIENLQRNIRQDWHSLKNKLNRYIALSGNLDLMLAMDLVDDSLNL